MPSQIKKLGSLAAKKDQPQAGPMLGWQTPQFTESLVRDGQTQILMIKVSPMWETTTSVGIPLGHPNPKCGAIPMILNLKNRTALFHSAPL